MKEKLLNLGDVWVSKLIAYLPTLALAIAILIIGMILAAIFSRGAKRLSKLLKLDKLFDRLNEVSLLSNNNIQIQPGTVISKFVYYLVWLITLIVIIDILNIDSLNQMIIEFFNFIPSILAAIMILILGLLISDFLRKGIYSAASSLRIPSARLISSIIFYFALINVAMLSLKQIKIETEFLEQNITVILAGLVFAFALGYGLSTRYKIENYFHKKDINAELKEGALIKIGEHQGKVLNIGNNYVTLSSEGSLTRIPLADFKKNTFTVINS